MEGLEKLKPLALLLLRLGLGVIFISHGYPKLFTQLQHTTQAFTSMGFPFYFAYIAGVLEFLAGFYLSLGCSRESRGCCSRSRWESRW
jgi:putative oxidoreductase